MTVFKNKNHLSDFLEKSKNKKLSVGLVPTMGALHDGHSSLIQEALRDNDLVVVSIFVNPTQFNNSKDLDNYPRHLSRDIDLLSSLSEENIYVYAPSTTDIYNDNVSKESFDFDGLENEMEGQFRPGHFDGVGTIIKKLFQIVQPDTAYFGEKDFQQLLIVKKLNEKEKLGVDVVGCAIYRADNGLAMSSRNERLTENQRNEAAFIYKTLQKAKSKFGIESAFKVKKWVENQFKKNSALNLEYFLIADAKTLKSINRKSAKKNYRAFIAVYVDDVRLIDNVALN